MSVDSGYAIKNTGCIPFRTGEYHAYHTSGIYLLAYCAFQHKFISLESTAAEILGLTERNSIAVKRIL